MTSDLVKQIKEQTQDIINIQKVAFEAGYEAASRDFAWWKDGVQYVGNCGKTLKEVLEKRNTKNENNGK